MSYLTYTSWSLQRRLDVLRGFVDWSPCGYRLLAFGHCFLFPFIPATVTILTLCDGGRTQRHRRLSKHPSSPTFGSYAIQNAYMFHSMSVYTCTCCLYSATDA